MERVWIVDGLSSVWVLIFVSDIVVYILLVDCVRVVLGVFVVDGFSVISLERVKVFVMSICVRVCVRLEFWIVFEYFLYFSDIEWEGECIVDGSIF